MRNSEHSSIADSLPRRWLLNQVVHKVPVSDERMSDPEEIDDNFASLCDVSFYQRASMFFNLS